jgi:hypothetical protein
MRHRDRRKPRPRPAARAISGAAVLALAMVIVLSVTGCGRTPPAPTPGSTGAESGAARSASAAAAPSLDEREPIDRAITLWMRGDHSGALLAVERAAGLPPTSIGEDPYLAISEAQIAATPPSEILALEQMKAEHLHPRVEAARGLFRAVLEEIPRRLEGSDVEGAVRLREGIASLAKWMTGPERSRVVNHAGRVFLTLIAERIDPALERARQDRP